MSLASIQKIGKLFPIEGADKIEGAEVLGWKCVVRKGQFKEGNLCIYIEIDTIIPKYLLTDNPEDKEEIRLRTVKMKGQISQGLVLPILTPSFINSFRITNESEEIMNHFTVELDNERLRIEDYSGSASFVRGEDITEILGIKKYEKSIPAPLQGIIKGNFPEFIPKTDEVKIQSEPELLELLKGKPYYITTKLDGTSATYYKFEGKFGVCSRNLELQDGDNVYWNMARKYKIEDWLPENYCIQGEIIGEGIQKNPLKINGQELYIFNTYDIKQGKNIDFIFSNNIVRDFIEEFVIKNKINIDIVPIEERTDDFSYTLEELLEKAKGNYSSGNRKEGIVVRSVDQTISFKVVNNDYLLKDEE